MEQKKADFLAQVVEIYTQYGIKSITMDDLARLLGISKKTIYTYIKDKNSLVEETLDYIHEKDSNHIFSCVKQYSNAINQLLAVSELISKRLNRIHPSVFYDIKKYYPQIIKKVQAHKATMVKQFVIDNLELGKQQGFYRMNINSEIMAQMYMSITDVLFQGHQFGPDSQCTFSEYYSEFFRYHIRGIASIKGLNHLQQLIETNNFELLK